MMPSPVRFPYTVTHFVVAVKLHVFFYEVKYYFAKNKKSYSSSKF